MLETICKQELFTRLVDCKTIIVCDDYYLTEDLRKEFPALYVKAFSLVREGQFPDALYVLINEQNVRPGVLTYLIREDVVENHLDEVSVEFLDSIDFDATEIVESEIVETESPIEDTVKEPCKVYEDMEFENLNDMVSALTPEMKVIARADMVKALREKRPDVSISPMEKGGISLTEGMVVLLRLRSKISRKEVRKVYPPTATLYTVYC